MMTLSNEEKAVCARVGVNETDYAARKALNAAGPMRVAIGARPIVRDAMADAEPADIAREAIKELQAFIRDPEHLDAMARAINASGLVDSLMKRVGASRRAATDG